MQRWGRAMGVGLVVSATALLGCPGSAGATAGDLESTFGTCGVSVQPAQLTTPFKTLELTDGRIVVVDQSADGIGLVRYRATGALDVSFGNRGRAALTIAAGVEPVDAAVAPDGKILVLVRSNSTTIANKVVRFTSAGVPDPSFGTGGIVDLAEEWVGKLVVQSDGKPVIAGVNVHNVIRRLLINGLLDFYAPQVDPLAVPQVVSLGIDSTDHLLVGEEMATGGISRFDVNGLPDPSFVRRPLTFTRPVSGYGIKTVTGGPAGTVLMTGWVEYPSGTPDYSNWFARFRANGTPDPAYGVKGYRLVQMRANSHLTRFDDDGSILVERNKWPGSAGDPGRIAIDRYDANGDHDPTYGKEQPYGLTNQARALGISVHDGVTIVILLSDLPSDRRQLTLVKFRTDALPRGAGYVLDDAGGLYPVRSGTDPAPPCVVDGPSYNGRHMAHGVTAIAGRGGYVVDAYGGIRAFSVGARSRPPAVTASPRWPGWDIARDITAFPDGRSGYVLDGYGGLSSWRTATGTAAPVTTGPYWPGWDIARGVAMLPNGNGGYVLDAYGGLHPFHVGGRSVPAVHGGPYWSGWDIARGVAILPDASGGYILDGFGGLHPFAIGNHALPPIPVRGAPNFANRDRAEGIAFVTG